MKKLFLLDAYALIYRAYYAFIKSPRLNSRGENTSAVLGFVNTLEEVLRKEQPDYIGVAFDPKGGTFRHEAYPEYKAQREETPEGIRFAVPYIKRILEAYRIPVLEVPGFEADDVIGTLAWRLASEEVEVFMMTPDKDYGQLLRPHVWMYRPHSGDKNFEIIGEKEICEKYGITKPSQVIDLLGLMGDASDNVPGCPGVGEKTAVKLLGEFGDIEQLLRRKDEVKGALGRKVQENEEQIRFSRFLVTIKTDVPVDVTLDDLCRAEKDVERLRQLFDELEFRNLTARILGQEAAPEPAAASQAPSSPRQQKLQRQNAGMGNLFAMGGETSTDATAATSTSVSFADPAMEHSLFSDSGDGEAKSTALASIHTIPHQYHLLEDEAEIAEFARKILSADTISMDSETTSTDAIEAELVGLSFATQEGEAWYVAVPSDRDAARRVVELLRPVYENERSLKVGQNLKYDMQVLASYGVTVRGLLFDTMIAHYVLHPELRHGMDYLAEIYLGYKTIHIDELIGARGKGQQSMRDLPPQRVYEYAAEDADVTLRLYHALNEELRAEPRLLSLFQEVEMPLVPVLCRMERNGVMIDTDSLRQTSAEFTERMKSIEQEIHEMAGEPFNISSPRQVGEVLFGRMHIVDKPKKTKTGQYVTSEDVLQNLSAKHPIVQKILDYRGYKKLLSTYIDALPQLIHPSTGHIHTSYNQTVTATGRLSSSNPNLQNIPIRDANGKEVRRAFIPDPGSEFFSADYSQIELRIMAHLSGDEHMVEAFREGHDIHRATAAKVYKLPMDKVTSEQRRKAKTANFGIIYGISAFGLAERMQVSRTEAKELIDEYFATYPKVKQYMDRSVEMAREHGYTETLFGRRCYLPDINSHNATVRGYAERNAINAPIQGTAADIIKLAMVHIDRRMQQEGLRSKMILQVHDELNFSVVPDERDRLQQLVIDEMQRACDLSVPLVADCGWGSNWLEAH